jgi:hypothetical protein
VREGLDTNALRFSNCLVVVRLLASALSTLAIIHLHTSHTAPAMDTKTWYISLFGAKEINHTHTVGVSVTGAVRGNNIN